MNKNPDRSMFPITKFNRDYMSNYPPQLLDTPERFHKYCEWHHYLKDGKFVYDIQGIIEEKHDDIELEFFSGFRSEGYYIRLKKEKSLFTRKKYIIGGGYHTAKYDRKMLENMYKDSADLEFLYDEYKHMPVNEGIRYISTKVRDRHSSEKLKYIIGVNKNQSTDYQRAGMTVAYIKINTNRYHPSILTEREIVQHLIIPDYDEGSYENLLDLYTSYLMPEDKFKESVKELKGDDLKIAKRFEVPLHAVRFRANMLGYESSYSN